MKILLIGATGMIGAAVAKALATRHEVLRASHSKSPLTVDMTDVDSIKRLFAQVGRVDAIVSTAGRATFGPLLQLTDADFSLCLTNKLMGQVNLVRHGAEFVNDDGSFILTGGIMSRQPMIGGAAISMDNAALEGFGRAAALELPRGIRINVIAPGWVTETMEAMKMDSISGTPVADVAEFYVQVVEGSMTGEVIDAMKGAG